jgi:ribosomal protein S18 acetylase RimI-like enzyme
VDNPVVSERDSSPVDSDLLIRRATEADLPRVLEICRQEFRLDAPSESELRECMEQFPDGFLVAQIGGEIAAYGLVLLQNGRPHWHSLAVAPRFRTRRGIATRIWLRYKSDLRNLGYTQVDGYTRCTNTPTIKMVTKWGWKHVGTVRNFYGSGGTARHVVGSLLDDGKTSLSGPNLKDRVKDLWGRLVEPRLAQQRLRVVWFDDWDAVLDNALRELPEMPNCPHDLYRMTMQEPSFTRKRIALVLRDRTPLAVVGLRENGDHWIPVMQGTIPGAIAPARDGFLLRALRALKADVRIGDGLPGRDDDEHRSPG